MGATDALRLVKRLGLHDPARVAAAAGALGRWGPTIATLYRAGALRHPLRPAVIDHRGALDYLQLDRRSSAFAKGLRAVGLRPGQRLGLLCFNHRDFVEANVAAAKAGLDVVYLNTGFASPQLADVIDREDIAGLVVDAELQPTVADINFAGPQIIADGSTGGGASEQHTHARRTPPRPVSTNDADPTSIVARVAHLGNDRASQGGQPRRRSR